MTKPFTEKTISRLSPLEQESLVWCYERYRQWVEANKDKENEGAVFITAIVELILGDFRDGELEAFQSLRRKGIINSVQKLKKAKGNDSNQYRALLDESVVRAYRILKQMYIAIFDRCDLMQDVPDGCPSEYAKADFVNRHAFVQWLEENGQQYLYDGKEKLSPYQYYIYEKGCNRKYCFAVAVVPVDLSRPWLIQSLNGREKIWYLDQRYEHNMVRPDVQPSVASYGFGGESCVVEGK